MSVPHTTHHAEPHHSGAGLAHHTTTQSSNLSDDEAVPGEDASEVTNLFSQRLRAWKHACGYLESYVEATEKHHHHSAKEYEKVLKTVNSPLKEAEHFDQNLGGVSGMFENIRSNTQGLANSHTETAKTLKGSVLPTFERLHSEIKNKTKELTKGASKGAKSVDKARKDTQKHIELLGQHTASFDSTGGKVTAADDPYVLQRGVMHRLNKQVIEENNNRQDMIAVQNSFAQFEAHILQSIQTGLGQFNQVVSKQADATKQLCGDMTSTSQRIPPDFEWNGFVKRNSGLLIDPAAPPRTVSSISFPNQHHKATQPIIAGALDRKGKIMKRYDTNYYVITPSKFLHEYKTDDDFQKDPSPEMSLYLPDAVVGGLDGQKFAIKGKDASKSKLAISMSHELQFKAHTPADAAKWYEIIRQAAGQVTDEKPEASAPNSPVEGNAQNFGSLAGATAGGAAATGAHPAAATGTTGVHPASTGVPGQATGHIVPQTESRPLQSIPHPVAPASHQGIGSTGTAVHPTSVDHPTTAGTAALPGTATGAPGTTTTGATGGLPPTV